MQANIVPLHTPLTLWKLLFWREKVKILSLSILCLFDLILYFPVNNFSVMLGRVFLGWTSTKQRLMCLAQGHNTLMPVRLEPVTPQSLVKLSTTEPLCSLIKCFGIMDLITFCNTFDLHLATICHEDLYFVYYRVAILHRPSQDFKIQVSVI